MSIDPDDAYDRWRDDVEAGIYQGPRTFRLDHAPVEPIERPPVATRERAVAHDDDSQRMRQLRAAAGLQLFRQSRGR